MALLETIELSQRYDGRDIVKSINLKVEKGEVFALIGFTGAGKTTLLRLIDLLDLPASGHIYFNSVDVTHLAKKRLEARRRMAFVLQKPVVFNMSVYDNIAYGLRLRGAGKISVRQKVSTILEMVDLVHFEDRNARTLSGGEAQRVAIGRAIAIDPELLLLDEPTANLDPISTLKIEELIKTIIHKYRTTIIMATHDMAQGQRLADRVSVLLNGEILQTGDWGEVFNAPRNRAIADFVGVENIIDGVIASSQDNIVTVDIGSNVIEAISDFPVGKEVCVCIRPEDITLALSRLSSSARNSFVGDVVRITSLGQLNRIEINCGFPLVALITGRSAGELGLEKGKRVYATFKATGVHVIERDNS